jgi:hypothetical protein
MAVLGFCFGSATGEQSVCTDSLIPAGVACPDLHRADNRAALVPQPPHNRLKPALHVHNRPGFTALTGARGNRTDEKPKIISALFFRVKYLKYGSGTARAAPNHRSI